MATIIFGMPSTGTSARVMLAWLGHPLTLIALAVLIVNDHLLKPAWPGVVTGKLSDFAGLLVAPPLVAMALALCLPRLRPRSVAIGASTVAGLGFAFVKSTAIGSAAASAGWSVVAGPSLIRADLTDLIALPAVLAAYALWRRASAQPVSSRSVRVFQAEWCCRSPCSGWSPPRLSNTPRRTPFSLTSMTGS